MALKKEVLISTLNRLRGVESDVVPIIDDSIVESIKNKPKVKKDGNQPFKTKGSGMTEGMDFTGIILATDNDLLHFSFGYES